jgi:hypothetical protein
LKEPRREAGARLVAGRGAPDAQEGFLDAVFGVDRVAAEMREEPEQAGAVALVELAEGVLVARGDSAHEGDVDVVGFATAPGRPSRFARRCSTGRFKIGRSL